jgi:hypothetical protein
MNNKQTAASMKTTLKLILAACLAVPFAACVKDVQGNINLQKK